MKVIRVKDQVEGGVVAFELLQEELKAGAKVLGLATGSTPIEFYKQVVASDLDFSNLVSVNLDEYVGLGVESDQSYVYFMKEHLFDKKPFKVSYLPNGLAEDLDEEVARYNALLAENPVDFQILGIGRNGHIGFNEPGSSFDGLTRVVDLTPSTIEANSRFFEKAEDVPTQAISMGIASIMSAKTVVLMAYGESKAEAVHQMVQGPVTAEVPASILQNHANVYVIVDEEAASRLK
ncbi:glucosamine-6-phosphate deaminase [Streptococcus sp. zg-86]|uniref:Glucosamine-6-phosphate deaminase n=1 Tax=Streptococcus zhangguiae TaxID=2664091 RepID=A0A6I4RRV4_9STRE|nr:MULTISPECIES: glucosamine-6-phosphate deaminase [unclassified Streptococcus]MTB64908.1 glucosamine-6-phosphate deaminase [Streptococcus sp. zg-86]MTB91022.1 glucosamine-6-phosphate deaminase [Streptococcus sp. zg-36]MWV56895.1 glucosamine-6-phosphate deaminase [Streptococcus sp. zg-70]QTH48305.1 glucosamine-6-phosphate deaminase [Streptococcus sp. zg-86]